jgi:hypothetical protein
MEVAMVRLNAKVLGLCGCVLALLLALPTYADPFFVRVYGRTYKIDPHYPPDEPKGPTPQEILKALPADLAKGSGFRPSHEQVLAEVEDRLWIAKSQLDEALDNAAASRDRRNMGDDARTLKQDITGSLAVGMAQNRSPELQTLYDRTRALNLLARELRRSLDLPVKTPDAGFSRPKLSPETEASYRALGFDPLEAYYAFRRVKAAFRSGDVKLLAQVAHYPLTVTGKVRRTIHNRDQLIAAKGTIMDARVREAVAKSTFETVFVRDKGMMLGEDAAWITRDKMGFGLGAITLEE